MKINKPLLFGLILTGLAVCVSCRKLDRSPNSPSDNETVARFFTEHASTDSRIQNIVAFLNQKNGKHNFVGKMVKQIGFPYWDKSMIISKASEGSRLSEDSGKIFYIPFVRDTQHYINSLLLLKTTTKDTSYQFILDWQYDLYGFDTTAPGLNAKDIFHLFARFDQQIFGHTTFRILDNRLFPPERPNDSLKTVVKIKNTTTSQRLLTLTPITLCSHEDVCYGPAWYEEWCDGGCTPTCEYFQYTSTQCTTIWIEGGWITLGGSTGGGSGGGSTGGDTYPQTPACPGTAQRPPGVEPCGPGWIPVLPIDSPTPPNDSTLAENLKRAYLKVKPVADSLHTKAQQNGHERGFSYVRTSNDTIAWNPIEGDSNSCSPLVGPGIIGLNHTHQDDGTPFGDKNQCFDAPDIFKFFYLFISNNPIQFQTLTTRDWVYAAVITDVALFKSYLQNITHTLRTDFMYTKLHNLYMDGMETCTNPTCNWEKQNEWGLLYITANNNSAVSGIKIFKSPRHNINFVPLTQ